MIKPAPQEHNHTEKVKKTFHLRVPGIYFFVFAFITVIVFEISSFLSGINYAVLRYKWNDTYTKLSTGYYKSSMLDQSLYPGMPSEVVRRTIIRGLEVEKLCNRSVTDGCWPKESYFADGSKAYSFESFPGFVLKNGVYVSGIQDTTGSCSSSSICNILSIDLNGSLKPNTFGKDQFRIYYYNDKIVPYYHGEDKYIGTTVKRYLYLK